MTPRTVHSLSNKKIWIVFIAITFLTASTFASSNPNCNSSNANTSLSSETCSVQQNYRLSRDVKPLNYKLKLWPNLANKTFKGFLTIKVQVMKPKRIISLHMKNLDLLSVKVRDIENDNLILKSTEANESLEQLHLKLTRKLAKGSYFLDFKFSGSLDKGLVGFYASSIRNGETMVASKFEPTYARQAFPCFDEPDFKATYDITLVKPVDYIALSNMNEVSKKLDNKTKTEEVKFATSVPMSTYLACFVICDFDFKETKILANGIGHDFNLKCFAQKGQTNKIEFAQDIGKRATEFYIQYYKVPYPLPKLDMIAIPDYVSGATEHWGLITYRQTAFLVDESTASSRNKINVANTVAHELAHMWFGNLVTMKWWDDIWLNEGFATYMQVKALNALEPSWTMLDQFLIQTLHPVLVIDSKLSSHPIVQKVDTPDQITAIFDRISYNKGSSVLRMLEGFIGEENFQNGVSDYLKKYKFRNTITQDLLSSLEPYFKKSNPDLSLKYIMDTWTRQMGYPVVSVKEGTSNSYLLTQTRFLLDPKATYENDTEFKYRWFVPITYTTSRGKQEHIVWFPDSSETVEIKLKEDEELLKINNNQVGYYRVNYSLEMWDTLKHELSARSELLSISDRAHILNDVFALAEANQLPYRVALQMTTYLTVETDFVPWFSAGRVFYALDTNLFNTPARKVLMNYVQHLVKPLYAKQSWEKSKLDIIEGLLRTKILSLSTYFGLPDANQKVRQLFLGWLNTHNSSDAANIEPDLRDFVYFYGMQSGSEDEWDKLWQIYLHEDDVQEQLKLRSALSAPYDTAILRKYLDLAWDEKNIRSQDYLNVVQLISSNPAGTQLVWGDVRARWPQLVERFTLNSRYLGDLIPEITSTFNTNDQLKEMESFFTMYPQAGAGETARKRALETVRNNIVWSQTHAPQVSEWLHEYVNQLK
ncbi:aminopeptidase A-like isoform X3 [Leptidea sinapis]|uniref:aminopeptidase A-like isoform X1 n=2 Tax=Leptidea sinapis TaxID=189913 RepID=UPI00213DA64B|nr:aminopeptidase A-like isoform X1 [Leptidea sinapis]XP_050673817.1 aminopeptidase A-like isoform X2 [Leptidea sinapis]XP_050673818.1 aminopeptidase A-like isoform X3 [Leptidea sinapis]